MSIDKYLDKILSKLVENENSTIEQNSNKKIPLKHADDPDEDFLPDQLEKGIKVEMEHTDDPEWAKAIAKAHLKEHPRYYDYLEKMEKQFNRH